MPETPVSGQWPTTSNLNLRAGQIKPNMVIVPVGADGTIRIYNNSGSADRRRRRRRLPRQRRRRHDAAGRVVPLTSPFRVFDTRAAAWGAVPLAPGKAEDWSFADFVKS